MCRLFLSINQQLDSITLINFFKQAHNIKNTPNNFSEFDADHHLDGYGVGWLDSNNKLQIYKNSNPYYKDNNFQNIFDQISQSRFVIGHLRNKEKKSEGDKKIVNCHPFVYDNYIFAHNGFVKDFKLNKEKILIMIDKKYIDKIIGETDTEHLFYLLLTVIDELNLENIKNKLEKLYQNAFEKVFKILNDQKIELVGNFIFSDLIKVIVIRYITPNFDRTKSYSRKYLPPSLYYCSEIDKNKVLISSEPVKWYYLLINPNSIVSFDCE